MSRQVSKHSLFRIADALGMPYHSRVTSKDLVYHLVNRCRSLVLELARAKHEIAELHAELSAARRDLEAFE